MAISKADLARFTRAGRSIKRKPAPRRSAPPRVSPTFARPLGDAAAPIKKAAVQARQRTVRARRAVPRAPSPALPVLRHPTRAQDQAVARLTVASVKRNAGQAPRGTSIRDRAQLERGYLRDARAGERGRAVRGASRRLGESRALKALQQAEEQVNRQAGGSRGQRVRAGEALLRASVGRAQAHSSTHKERVESAAYHAAIDPNNSGVTTPALAILSQTLRPIHAIAGGVDARVRGGSAADARSAGVRGLTKNKGPLFGDVLRHAGVPKGVAGPAGFVLDVGLDPTTYVTGGTGTLAEKIAAKEAAKVTRAATRSAAPGVDAAVRRAGAEAARKYATHPKQNALVQAAEDRVRAAAETRVKSAASIAGGRKAATPKSGTGLTVKFAGHEVPLVRAATAGAARNAGRAVRKVTPGKVQAKAGAAGGELKNLARDVRPTMTPAGMKAAEFRQVHDAAAAARVQGAYARTYAQRFARAVQKHVPASADQAAVIRALEHNQIGRLPEHLRQAAVRIRSELRHGRRQAVRSGIAVKDVTKGRVAGDAKDYFPHALDDALRKGEGVVDAPPVMVEGVGRRTIQLGSATKRGDRRPIDVINAAAPGKFSQDAPLVIANHIAQLGEATARATFNQALRKVGREVKWGDAVPLDKSEALYSIKGANIKKHEPGQGKVDGARYFVLNKELADKELASLAPVVENSTLGRAVNKGTQAWKRAALASFAYHIRNAIGDTSMAYYQQPGRRLPVTSGQAGKVLKEQRRQNKQVDQLAFPTPSGKTVKVAGKREPVGKVLKTMQDNAAMQTGYVGRELNDLVGRDASGAVKKVRRGSGKIQGVLQARENLMRVGTAKHVLDTGESAAIAGRTSREAHIDYGDLTPFERKLRRAPVPFYTFAARNLPIQTKALLKTPGKIANFAKLREEAARSLGLQPGWEDNLSEYQRRALVIPVGKTKDGRVRVFDMGLPITTLNELPASASAKDYISELGQFGTQMLGPAFKIPIELETGQDTFRRAPIEPPGRTLIPAPSWLMTILPKGAEKKLGLVMGNDPKTGERVPFWPAKNAYLLRQATPGPLGQANQLATKGTNRRGQTHGAEKTLSVLSGVKVTYTDKIAQDTTRVFDELDKIKKQKGDLQVRGLKMDKDGYATPAYKRLQDRERKLNAMKGDLQKAAGRPGTVAVKQRPLTAKQQVAKEIADYHKSSSPAAVKQKVLDEIAKFKQQQGG